VTASPSPPDTELLTALEPALAIIGLERRPFAYASSFRIEEIDVRLGPLEGGRSLTLLFKDLSPEGMLDGARRAKPFFLYDPRREIEMYRRILQPGRFGTATCYGAVADAAAGRYWLFLEKVPGRELYQVGELAVWQQAARWLAGFHARFAGRDELSPLAQDSHLLLYGADSYRRWIDRARAAHPSLDRLAERYDQVVDHLVALPVTVLHGDFYASNVLVEQTGEDLRICPVDWELAAVGPGLFDLAALTAGQWTEAERVVVAMAYYDVHPLSACHSLDGPAFLEALDWCRLHLAVQWLGWAPDWSPPAEHAHDWRWASRTSWVYEQQMPDRQRRRFRPEPRREPGDRRGPRARHRHQRQPDGALAGRRGGGHLRTGAPLLKRRPALRPRRVDVPRRHLGPAL
jgi:Ser/Thr protein kinase RdoA (MazF antagonist)